MARNHAPTLETLNRQVFDADLRHAHELRSQYLASLIARATKAILTWFRAKAPKRRYEHLSNHVLNDIGFHRDPFLGLVLAALSQDALSLSPTGTPSAPAYWNSAPVPAKIANDSDDTLKAA